VADLTFFNSYDLLRACYPVNVLGTMNCIAYLIIVNRV